MSKTQNFAEITPNLPFSEFIFYELYRETFEHSELGRMKKILPLHKMAESFGLVSKRMISKRGRKSFLTTEGEVTLKLICDILSIRSIRRQTTNYWMPLRWSWTGCCNEGWLPINSKRKQYKDNP